MCLPDIPFGGATLDKSDIIWDECEKFQGIGFTKTILVKSSGSFTSMVCAKSSLIENLPHKLLSNSLFIDLWAGFVTDFFRVETNSLFFVIFPYVRRFVGIRDHVLTDSRTPAVSNIKLFHVIAKQLIRSLREMPNFIDFGHDIPHLDRFYKLDTDPTPRESPLLIRVAAARRLVFRCARRYDIRGTWVFLRICKAVRGEVICEGGVHNGLDKSVIIFNWFKIVIKDLRVTDWIVFSSLAVGV